MAGVGDRVQESGGVTSNGVVVSILLAEFDIDRGSTLKLRYPCAVEGYDDEYALLCRMLSASYW